MRSHNNLRSKVGDQDPIIKCRPFVIYLMSVDLWTLILLVSLSPSTNTIPTLLYGKN